MLPDFFLQALHEKYTHNEVRTADIQGLQREFFGRMEKLLIKIPKGWKFLMNGKCVEQAERSGAGMMS